MLPDRTPLQIYAHVAGAVGWAPALVRALGRQETMNADENPNWIRFESHKWKLYRMASREAKAFDSHRNPRTIVDRWAAFHRMDMVCEADAAINPAARDAAILAHSFGFSQIMGFNHKFAGFETARAFYHAMRTIEGQAAATIAMIRSSPRLVELGRRCDPTPRARDAARRWRLGDLSEMASIWNGPGFETTNHDKGLVHHLAFARREEATSVGMA